jgi:hypothetical protein
MWLTQNGGTMPGRTMTGGSVWGPVEGQEQFVERLFADPNRNIVNNPGWPGIIGNPLGLQPVQPLPNPHLVGPALIPVMQVFDAFTAPRPPQIPSPVQEECCIRTCEPDSWHPDGTPIWPKPPGGPVAHGPNGSIVAPTPSLPQTPQGVTNNGGTVIGDTYGPAGTGPGPSQSAAVDPRAARARKMGVWAALLGAGAAGLAMIGGA